MAYKLPFHVLKRKYGIRSYRSILLFILATGFLGFLLHVKFSLMMTSKWSHVQVGSQPTTNTYLIISTYLKGGGNVLGDVLKSRPSSFYTFEPLFTLSPWHYLSNRTRKCASLHYECLEDRSSLDVALDKVRSAFSCDIPNVIGNFYHPRWDLAGPSWTHYHSCIDQSMPIDACARELSRDCENSMSRMVKLERLSLEVIESLLKENKSITVVHMFRDPRAIIHGNVQEGKFPQLTSLDGIQSYAKSLCSRMEQDFDFGNKLGTLYPKQFKMLLYEDFVADMEGVLRLIMRFVGIPFKVKDKDYIQAASRLRAEEFAIKKAMREFKVSDRDVFIEENSMRVVLNINQTSERLEKREINVRNRGKVFRSARPETMIDFDEYVHPFLWRKDIKFHMMRTIDSMCGNVYEKIGYNTYKSEELLRNIEDWPSFGGKGIYPL